MPTVPDKALLNLIDELASTTPEDMAAVLDLLDARSAAQVRALLVAYTDVEGISEIGHERPEAQINTSGLSEWLAARVLGTSPDGTKDWSITADTHNTLREAMAALPVPSEHPTDTLMSMGPLPSKEKRRGLPPFTKSQRT